MYQARNGPVGRRLVFSANPGRSGSGYLAGLLGAHPDVDAGHERLPAMVDRWVRRVNTYGLEESRSERRLKVGAIRSELANLTDMTVYADTSHLFVKTFADVVLEAFDHEQLCVISLRRGLLDTARSFAELDEFGPTRRSWHDFLPIATAPAARFRLESEDVRSRFDLIFAYLVDHVARSADVRRSAPGVRWIEAELSRISTEAGARDLFQQLGLEPPDQLDALVAVRPNQKLTEKETAGQHVSLGLMEARLEDFCARFGERVEVADFLRWYEWGTR